MSSLLIQHTRRLAGVLVLGLLLGGCASTWQTEKLQSDPPRGLPPLQELTQTPFFPQQQYQCGPAALATVLNHYAIAISPQELVPKVYLPAREGSLQVEMTATARQYGMLVYPLRPELADLLAEVAAGYPVLVLQNLSFNWLPQWHYAVVVGYDLVNSEVVLRSGTTRRWVTSLAAFERTWARANYWALMVLPPDQIPSTAEPLRYLNAALELEQTSQPAAAYRAYEAAAKRWPNWPQIWLSLGNATYQRHQFQESVEAFLNVTRLEPASVTGWNNLAYALLELGCPQQAKQAIACASDLAPQDTNIQDSQKDIEAGAAGRDRSAECPRIQCPVP
jgi:tetratricopeptide (TPR) repeat protein